jgi:hypothetical protein
MSTTTTPGQRTESTGVAFPEVDGARSTSRTGRAVLADAARAVDTALAAAITSERDWRKAYPDHIRALVEAELRAGDGAAGVPRAGLTSLHHRFVFDREGEDLPLEEALAAPTSQLHTAEVSGRGRPAPELTIPYRGQRLHGDALRRQLDAWVEAGTVEPSLGEAVRRVMDNPDWRDLSDRTVVVLGAGAEMGPLTSLCSWGADVALVDLPSPPVWERILATVRAGAGTARIPLQRPSDETDDARLAEDAGADLLTETPELRAWLDELEGHLTVGNYVYADGADNVRVSMAADALTTHLCRVRDEVSLAVLLTPTDVYAAPEEAVLDSQERFTEASSTAGLLRRISGGRVYAPNYQGLTTTPGGYRYGIADCLVSQQGPNYALAKRLHRWRARLAREEGTVVSANVAPATSTRSVTKNRILAAAYAGAPRFGVEVFEPATSNALMAALLVHDLRNPRAAGNPEVPLPHPLDLFAQEAGHGGMWRNPFAPRSVLTLAAVRGLVSRG